MRVIVCKKVSKRTEVHTFTLPSQVYTSNRIHYSMYIYNITSRRMRVPD